MRDPEASEPFTQPQLEHVFECCDRDPSPVIGKAARFLAYAGAHISVLSGGSEQVLVHDAPGISHYEFVYHESLRSNAVRGDHIYWRRPKNQKPIGMPLSRHLAGWLPEWLDQPRPTSRGRYNQLFDRVGEAASLQINPLRFRHTCAVLLYHVYGMKAPVVERLLGVTPQTLVTYVMNPAYMVADELRQKGW